MATTIVTQGQGYTIARSDEAHSAVPYRPSGFGGGNKNHGYFDLVDRPELAAFIPEAQRSAGLLRLLQTVNKRGSAFLTCGCECGLVARETVASDEPDRYVGSYIAIAFRQPERNTPDRICDLARSLLSRVTGSAEHHISFELTLVPLLDFFGHGRCCILHVNASGFGHTDQQAWGAFDFACAALATATDQLNALPENAPLFTGQQPLFVRSAQAVPA
ncbi:hypothetical protein GOB93_10015 [Acetobacter musti]|uniref:Uncharacterized protein n=1 Tax=Acetobacter musti TaxID=864732 RepID=A0ABX0JPR3_9PROT|nr:hypothetical protein [Acetobacter musti]NHN84975.1 hypothetical protein [Acetobacter musti]